MIQYETQPQHTPVSSIPPSIVEAVCKVMAGIDAVKKSQKNMHGNYLFASTDDIYAEIIRKQAAAGLMVMCLEENVPEITRVEKDGKTSQWAKFTFSFVLATKDATWADPRSRRTLYVMVNGPQTFQAAQSYASKAFLKSLYMLPTGDMDLDSLAQSDTEEGQSALNGKAKRKSSYGAKKDGATTELFNEIRREIAASINSDHLKHLRAEVYAEDWATMPVKWVELLDHEYEDRLDTFNAEAA